MFPANFIDVFLDGFNGVRYLTAGPVVRVKDIQGLNLTLADASTEPTLDREGRTCFGEVGRTCEIFVIVGHSLLGGEQISFEEVRIYDYV